MLTEAGKLHPELQEQRIEKTDNTTKISSHSPVCDVTIVTKQEFHLLVSASKNETVMGIHLGLRCVYIYIFPS